ncbi:wxL domain surface protein (plasmid) [Enterococcus mundtii QU 25]|uniref:WxL domain-containing protein n=1 Tax=Enterococcus mundtii TaxID=53346 RepID=UPI0003C542BC|nr:WxL domain-containing protein [Enterococcus mundtii]BAO08465.1 wxL domain surface protein [Enterococcus mundtii QU 25]
MKTSTYHKLIVFCTSIFCIQTVALPTTALFSTSVEAIDVQEVTTDSKTLATDYLSGLKEVEELPLLFSSSYLRITGEVTKPVSVSFYANQLTQEAKIRLPKEAVVDKDRLPVGLTITEISEDNYWLLYSEIPRETFTVPLVFQEAGTYEASIEEAKTIIDIALPTNSLEQTEEEKNSVEQEADDTTDGVTDDATEETQHEMKELENDEHVGDEATSSIEKKEVTPTEFSGQVIEVSTMAEFREAIADPDVSTISVQANLTESTPNIMTIDHPIKIQGNGHTLTFGNNGSYFQLAKVSEPMTFRLENTTVTKTGTIPLVNATTEVSRNWTLEIEDVTEVNANTMRLASLPEGMVQFTGGTNNFTRTSSTETFIEAKEVKAINQAQVTIIRGNATIFLSAVTVSKPKLSIENGAKLVISTSSGAANTIDFRGDNPELFLQSSGQLDVITLGTTATPTDTTNNAIALTGITPKIAVNSGSNLAITSTGAKRGLYLSGSHAEIYIDSSELSVSSETTAGAFLNGNNSTINLKSSRASFVSTSGRSILIQGTDATLSMYNSELSSTSTGNMTSENILIGNNNVRPTLVLNGKSKLIATSLSSDNSSDALNSQINVSGKNPSIIVADNSEIDILTTANNRNGLVLNGSNSNLEVSDSKLNIETTSGQSLRLEGDGIESIFKDGAEVNLNSANSNAFFVSGRNSEITISDTNTRIKLSSQITAGEGRATFLIQTPSQLEDTGKLIVTNNATLEVKSNLSTAINITSLGYTFDISNGTLKAHSNSSNGDHAVIRFLYFGLANFTVRENAYMEVNKTGGTAPLIRIPSGGNTFEVSDGGNVNLYNPGNGVASDGNIAGGNQAIYYARGINTNGKNNDFSVTGMTSKFKAITDNGPVIVMDSFFKSNINVESGYLDIEGKTSSSSNGVFQAGEIYVDIDNPIFFDFRNTRVGGGNIFSVSNGSTLNASNSDLSVWRNGVDLEGVPDLNFRSIDYIFSGENFNTLSGTSDPDQLNTNVFGSLGLTAYSRMSSNNGRWAIADELRVPTNADKKIHGRVSLPVGFDDSRPAWDDEAVVTIEVESPTGDKIDYTTKTVGDSNESPGISIYGEEPRGGLFEVQLDEPLEAGSKVRISKVELSSGELTTGFDHQILTETVEVFPIVPPKPATFVSSIISRNSQKIEGVSENPNVSVTATHNGQEIDTENVEVDENGKFSIDLSTIQLAEDDEIQVFLRDKNGSAKAAGIVNPPLTNDEQGNINPAQTLDFHDVTFAAATILTVGNWDPVAPVDPLDPENEMLPENQPDLPEEQGPLSIDFVSRFNFGRQNISVKDKTYYAKPQRLLNEDGTVNEAEERPNFVQISDRRPDDERNGWQLSVTQNGQFSNQSGHELIGAEIQLFNQELVTTQGGTMPELQEESGQQILPNTRKVLIQAKGESGTGTWIYRFGDQQTAGKSVGLYVPKGTNPEATNYSTHLTWELSAVPDN